jgi:hypothetical protein
MAAGTGIVEIPWRTRDGRTVAIAAALGGIDESVAACRVLLFLNTSYDG